MPTVAVQRAGSGAGTVTSGPAGIDCGALCSAPFPFNEALTLTATPAAGSSFAGWSGGGCSGTGACEIAALSAATTVTATFTAEPSSPSPSEETTPVTSARPNTKLQRAKIRPRKGFARFRFKAIGEATGFQCALTRRGRRSASGAVAPRTPTAT